MLFGTETVEIGILNFIQDIFGNSLLDFIMPLITALGNAGAIWIILTLMLLFSRKYRKIGLTMALSLILCLIFGNIILKPLIARPRPFTVDPSIRLLISAPKDLSFPSGHTLASFTSAFVLLFSTDDGIKKPFAIASTVLAALIAISRLYLRVHYPTDVLAGIVISYIVARIAVFIINSIQKNSDRG